MKPGALPQWDSVVGRATIGDQLRRNAQRYPNKPAVVFYHPRDGRQQLTYRELNGAVNRAANSFAELGLGRGDVVGIMSRNSPHFIISFYAALKLGAAVTGLNFTFKQPEMEYQLGHSEARILLVEDVFAETAANLLKTVDSLQHVIVSDVTAPPADSGFTLFSDLIAETVSAAEPPSEVTERDVAFIQYTSGTEAFPKAVMIPHRNYLISTTPAWMASLGLSPREVWLFLMPFFTIAGLGSMTSLTLLGATIVLVHAVDPPAALAMIADERVTIMAQTPTFYLAMTQVDGFEEADVSTLERCITYGGTVPQAMIDGWQRTKPDILWGTYWGQSELSQLGSVGWFTTLDDVPDGDPSWIGKPVPQLEIRVVDGNGEDTETGELLCRSPSVMLGYYKDIERTAATVKDGWLHTGDVVRRDDEGNLFFYDRKKDMIKTGGMNVSSQEVERTIYGFDGVLQCAVVGVADDYWSEAVTAFVVPADGVEIDVAALIEHCKENMAGYKVPKAVHSIAALPVDKQGKVLKRELRTLASPDQD